MKRKRDQPMTAVGTFVPGQRMTASNTSGSMNTVTGTIVSPVLPGIGVPFQWGPSWPLVHTWPSIEPQIHTGHILSDPQVVSHCPFCGSGDIVAGADQTISCSFCNRSVLVMEQPQYNSMPGQPGASTDATLPGGQASPAGPTEEGVAGDPADQPDAPGSSVTAPTDTPVHHPVNPQTDPDTLKKAPPFSFSKSSLRQDETIFRTASGYQLNESDFVKHVAFRVDRDFLVRG